MPSQNMFKKWFYQQNNYIKSLPYYWFLYLEIEFPITTFKMFKNNSLDLGYFYNDDVDLGSVKFENSLKPSKTEGVPILSPVSDKGYFTFSRRENKKGKLWNVKVNLVTYL